MGAACRAEDTAGRWGGEEFLVVAPMTDLAGGAELGERIRGHIGNTAMQIGDGPEIGVTVSIGVASGFHAMDVLVREADAALYVAKRDGRNRVITSTGET